VSIIDNNVDLAVISKAHKNPGLEIHPIGLKGKMAV
jgi:hypothetical protein